jgi:stage V sporulation protein S
VYAIGVGAVNQATKAVIIARGYLKQDGLDLVCVPTFVELDINGVERTAIKLSVESRPFAEETEGRSRAASA